MNRSYYIYSSGKLSRKDNTLQFVNSEGEKRDLPVEQIEDIYIMSEMTLNTKLLNFAAQNGIVLHFFNYYQFYSGSFYPREQLLAGQLLVKQAEAYSNFDKRLELAKQFIKAASANIYRNLRYYNGRGKDLELPMKQIEHYRKQIDKQAGIKDLMGIEGNIRKIYYSTWSTIIDQDIEFERRIMHPPDNRMNSLISFVNSLIYTKVLTEIYHTQLNPTISYLHEPGTRRFSLCLDLAEIFKPLIGDRLIFSLLNRKQITDSSFLNDLEGLKLKKEASQLILSELDERMKKTIKHKELGKSVSYQYLIRLEAYKLIKHLLGEKEYSGFEIWW
ncbi:type I-B CRISPR-associated endonuclease Cas1b [Anaerovorax odorimutans]|uniref:CRISPR-associated endonuclease Cas1 n=1 Tax=Anaerovorax odorimutans TaxID=109327 RepID=A0ABT1RLN1_9FIRM|nr:type I-B CRISPR-associated endonuclease Cas1b [Anaerovorax odorimutans]MCQ4636088.1 type I-B CRISPR-associated endonuclease Cas1b [Anaerovorax odorimutans]